MLLGQHAIHPDVDPGQKRDDDGSDETDKKPSAGGTAVKDRYDQGYQIQSGEQNDTEQRCNSLGFAPWSPIFFFVL